MLPSFVLLLKVTSNVESRTIIHGETISIQLGYFEGVRGELSISSPNVTLHLIRGAQQR